MKNACCFTGHRQLPAEDYERIRDLTRLYVEFLIRKGVCVFFAGGAVGYDMICSLIVLDFMEIYPNIRLILAIPCPDYDRFFSKSSRKIYREIFEKADGIVIVSEKYTKDCMKKRNMYMADRSAFLICYCTKDTGGSFFTRNYARRKKLTIYNVIPEATLEKTL